MTQIFGNNRYRPVQPLFGCELKRRYSTEGQALTAATRAAGKYNTNRLRVYQCDLCRGWHLTSRVSTIT